MSSNWIDVANKYDADKRAAYVDPWEIITRICEALPHEEARIWSVTGDDEILCENEQTAETLADLFDAMYGEPTVNTGYYDPEDDERSGETDERTGYYYVTID